MAALWHPLGLLHFLVCPHRVLQWGSKKRPKWLKINGLGHCLGTLLGRPIWIIQTQIAFPCSVAFILHFREAFPCSVAFVLGFLMFPWAVQHGPVRASEVSINLMDFYIFWKKSKNDDVPEVDAKDQNIENQLEKSILFVTNSVLMQRADRFSMFLIQNGVLRGRLLGRIFDLSLQKQLFRTPIQSTSSRLQFWTKRFHPKSGSLGGSPWDAFLTYRSKCNFYQTPI